MSAIWPGALLVVYLGVTGILLLSGHSRLTLFGIAWHFALLAASAAATWLGIVPRWLRAWAPLLALLSLYAEMPMLISAAGHGRYFDAEVMRWEYTLFGWQPAIEWARRWPSRIASEVLHAAYLSYYGIIFSVPVALYRARRTAAFGEAVFVLMFTFVACFICYIVFPVAGPRYFWDATIRTSGGPVRATAVWLLEARSSRGTAFPSSHVAVGVTQSMLAVRYFGTRGLLLGALAFGLALGAVYGGFHYAVDVLSGLIFGALTTALGLAIHRQLVSTTVQAKASAPT